MTTFRDLRAFVVKNVQYSLLLLISQMKTSHCVSIATIEKHISIWVKKHTHTIF
jgi:hypothetical protein